MSEFLLNIIEEHDSIENFYYIQDGTLVHLDETIGENRHLVSDVFYIRGNHGDSYHEFDSYDCGTPYLYTGKLFKTDTFERGTAKHDAINKLELEKSNLNKEISALRNEKYELEKARRVNSSMYEDNKTISMTLKLLENTKRYILVRESNWRYHLIDNLNKDYIGYDEESDTSSNKYKDVEFTIYRDFSRNTNVKDRLFNFKIKLTKNNKDHWRDDVDYVADRNSIGVDVEFFDKLEEMQDTVDNWFKENKLDNQTYIKIIKECNLKLNPESGQKFKDNLIKSQSNQLQHKIKYRNDSEADIVKINNLIEEYKEIPVTDIDAFLKIIHGGSRF